MEGVGGGDSRGGVKLRSQTGTLQLGRLEDSPPPPCRKGLHFLADTLPFVHPDPLPPKQRCCPRVHAPRSPSSPSSGSSRFPDFYPQSLPFSPDHRKLSRHPLWEQTSGQAAGGTDTCSVPQPLPLHGVGKWKSSNSVTGQSSGVLLSQVSPSDFFLPGQVVS